jgi:hypothetical protein
MEEEEEFSQGRFIDKKPRKARKVKTKEKDIPTDSKGRKKRKVTKSRKEKDKKGRTSKLGAKIKTSNSFPWISSNR